MPGWCGATCGRGARFRAPAQEHTVCRRDPRLKLAERDATTRRRRSRPGIEIRAAFRAFDPAKPEDKAILDLQRTKRFIPTRPENYQTIEAAARAAGLLKE